MYPGTTGQKTKEPLDVSRCGSKCTRRESNPQPSVPKTDALSIELQVPVGGNCLCFGAMMQGWLVLVAVGLRGEAGGIAGTGVPGE